MKVSIFYHKLANVSGNLFTHTVHIGNHAFEMSHDADKPNGLCMYLGHKKQWQAPKKAEVVALNDAPKGMQKRIAFLLASVNS